jgi:hypothetical protein
MNLGATAIFPVAHASRVPAMASSPTRTFPNTRNLETLDYFLKACCGETLQPARETRALPRASGPNHAS